MDLDSIDGMKRIDSNEETDKKSQDLANKIIELLNDFNFGKEHKPIRSERITAYSVAMCALDLVDESMHRNMLKDNALMELNTWQGIKRTLGGIDMSIVDTAKQNAN